MSMRDKMLIEGSQAVHHKAGESIRARTPHVFCVFRVWNRHAKSLSMNTWAKNRDLLVCSALQAASTPHKSAHA